MDGYWTHEKFGKIPVGWEVKDLKDVCYINRKSLPTNTSPDFLFRYIPIECVSTGEIDFVNCPLFSFRDAPGRARRLVEDNDILVSGVRPNLKSFAIYKRPDGNNWICTTGIYVLTAKCKESSVLIYNELLSRIGDIQFYRMVAGSNYPAISDSDIRKIKILFPPLPEQKSIAKILSTVDDAIRSTNETIQKLERVKKSLMQNLLSGKMRPDGTMRSDDEFFKDEKMGLVPKGWKCVKMKDVGFVQTGKTPPTAESNVFADTLSEGYMFITPGDLGESKYIADSERYVTDKGISFSYRLPKGSIVIVCIGSTIGKIGIISNESCTNQQINALIVNGQNNNEFLYYMMQYRTPHFKEIAGINATPQINKSTFQKYKIVIPTDALEQVSIANKLCTLDLKIYNKYNKITKLELLKKSLMQQLLTGKVRVKI